MGDCSKTNHDHPGSSAADRCFLIGLPLEPVDPFEAPVTETPSLAKAMNLTFTDRSQHPLRSS